MPFIKDCCTETVFNQLKLPDGLRDSEFNLMNQTIVYDLAMKVALIQQPFEHSTYPDCRYSLYISGVYLNVWEGVDPYSIKVWVSDKSKGFDDLFLKEILQQSFSIYNKVIINISDITVKGRW